MTGADDEFTCPCCLTIPAEGFTHYIFQGRGSINEQFCSAECRTIYLTNAVTGKITHFILH